MMKYFGKCSHCKNTFKYLCFYHSRHHDYDNAGDYNCSRKEEKKHLKCLVYIHDNNPRDPAVTPTQRKNPNSTKSLVPGGILVNIVCRIIMSTHIDLRL